MVLMETIVTMEQAIRLALADPRVAGEFNDCLGDAIGVVSVAAQKAIERQAPLAEDWQADKREAELDKAFSPLYDDLATEFFPVVCERFVAAAKGVTE
jgi:hypothetical protein